MTVISDDAVEKIKSKALEFLEKEKLTLDRLLGNSSTEEERKLAYLIVVNAYLAGADDGLKIVNDKLRQKYGYGF